MPMPKLALRDLWAVLTIVALLKALDGCDRKMESLRILKFTLRTLALAVAVIAVGMGALLNPTTRVAAVVVNGVLVAVLVAACVAVGSRQPARSFWLGFALACLWALLTDELGRREIITPVVFSRTLASMIEEALPPIPPVRGEPGTTLYFRTGGKYPIQYSILDDDGTTEAVGFMTMEQMQREGLIDEIGPLEDLPHIDDRPNSEARSTICGYVLAFFLGLVGGLLSFAVRRRGDRRVAT